MDTRDLEEVKKSETTGNKIKFSLVSLNEKSEEALEETDQQDARLNQLETCLNELPPAGRQLVQAAYEPGASIDELAQSAGKNANALYQKLWRLRQVLRECVERSMENQSELNLSKGSS